MSSSPARRHRRSKTRAALVQAQRSEARARAAEAERQSRQELQDIIDRGLGHVADSLSRPAP